MSDIGMILTTLFGLYVIGAIAFLVSENRNPQATLAWMLAFFFIPGIGLLLYLFFGRDRKAFSKQNRLLKQEIEVHAALLLRPLLERQDAAIRKLESRGASHRRLMMLVRRNSRSVLTTRNRVEILQDAQTFYPSLMRDMRAARRSGIHPNASPLHRSPAIPSGTA